MKIIQKRNSNIFEMWQNLIIFEERDDKKNDNTVQQCFSNFSVKSKKDDYLLKT